MKTEIEKLGLKAVALAQRPSVQSTGGPAAAGRLQHLGRTQDVGWVRYALDQFEVGYDLIYKERIREGICAMPTT